MSTDSSVISGHSPHSLDQKYIQRTKLTKFVNINDESVVSKKDNYDDIFCLHGSPSCFKFHQQQAALEPFGSFQWQSGLWGIPRCPKSSQRTARPTRIYIDRPLIKKPSTIPICSSWADKRSPSHIRPT